LTKPKRRAVKAPALPAPQSREEVALLIARIGECQRRRQVIEAAMGDEMAAIKERFEAQAQPLAEEIGQLTSGVQIWCEANRDDICPKGSKTAPFPTGEVSWRVTPPAVRVSGAEAVMDTLRRLGLHRFLRAKEEINKEAILHEPEAIKGIAGIQITQKEELIVRPFETQLDEVA
jgi:phage host-nuclease inhibitor protein Gam